VRFNMRRLPFMALLVGVVLLSGGLLGSAGAVAAGRQQDRTLQHDADQVAAAFSSYFERSSSIDLLLAQNPAFRPPGHQVVDNLHANLALAYLESLYPGVIGEACLIDDRGRELARVTDSHATPAAQLSTNEAGNAFFVPTLALAPGQVFQAQPYVSPDTRRWVISNSTWIRRVDGSALVVHFEVDLGSFTKYLVGSGSRHVAVVDRRTGRTILQDKLPLPKVSPPGAFRRSPAAVALHSSTADQAPIASAGRRLAAAPVGQPAGNANDWVVVEWSTARASIVPPWVGGSAGLVGLGLILFFLLSLRREQGVLRLAARLDHLTGMANRKALEEALAAAVAGAPHVDGNRVAVLMLDLDGFKQINDTLGHDRGDLVLQEIGRRLRANTFEYDTAARLGGDEFAVVLRNLRDIDDVAVVAHRLREALIRPIDIDGIPRLVGVSVGAAVHVDHGRTAAELLSAADAAMYQAKRGREGVRVYDAGTAAGANASWLAAELLIAIENAELDLAFQPVFSLTTGQVVGVEASARWCRTGQPEMPPSEFAALAEQAGLSRPLTHLVLRQALDEARTWYAAGAPIPISVNLGTHLVADRSLADQIGHLLSERGLDGTALVLDINEAVLAKDLDVTTEVLTNLRSTGVRIQLADFGSGYASFKALHHLPLDGVKLDCHHLNNSTDSGRRLLEATIDIGRSLGLDIIAAGIEDNTSLQNLRRLEVPTGQGIHLSPPMDPQALHALLRLQFAPAPKAARRVDTQSDSHPPVLR